MLNAPATARHFRPVLPVAVKIAATTPQDSVVIGERAEKGPEKAKAGPERNSARAKTGLDRGTARAAS